jgi:AraC-like DNA-binding protein
MIVAGPDTRAHLTPVRAGARYVGVRFRPGQGPGVLGVPAAELRDHRLALEQLWPTGEVRRLTEVVTAATDRPAALATEIGRYLRRAGPIDPRADAVSGHLRAGHSIAVTADAVRLGPRQLYRMSLAAFGYGPKTLARVLRFDRAVALARTGVAFATVAATAGYADQAHLSREVRELAGVPLRDLVA